MRIRSLVIIVFLCFGAFPLQKVLAFDTAAVNSPEELTLEEIEILENLDFLQDLDLLQEDLVMVEKFDESGENDAQ